MKIILVQIYRFSPEEWLLRKMAEVFRRSGYRMVVWTNREHGTAGLPAVPLSRGDEDDAFLNIRCSQETSWSNFSNWEAFEKQFQDRYGRSEPAYDSLRCHQVSSALFDQLRPSLFLSWCGMSPWFAIPKEIANERNIPVLTWEAGMLPQTLLLDQNGICADGQFVNKPTPSQEAHSLTAAKKYISNWQFELINAKDTRAAPNPGSQAIRVLVLGSMDSANGVFRPLGSGPSTLPEYTDGIDLAIKISESGSWKTIYRPHPNEPSLPLIRLRQSRVDIDRSENLVESILNADVIVGYGSKADYIAIALGKPFIMAGLGLITGKGCAYETIRRSDMEHVIKQAHQYGQSERQKERFAEMISWMLTETHYNRTEEGPCEKGVSELVVDALSYIRTADHSGGFKGLLTLKGQAWLRNEALRYQLHDTCYLPQNAYCELALQISQLPNSYIAIIDFDHTLFLGNSTEQFLLSVYPRLWGEVIDKSARFFWNNCGRCRGSEIDRWRVLAAIIFAPWSLLWWKSAAQRQIKMRWNKSLEESATDGRNTPTVIISLGFSQLIKPLVKERYKSKSLTYQPRLICSDLLRPSGSLRKLGKVRALKAAIPEINWSECFAVSDSEEDRDLLLRCRKGFYLQWNEPPTNPRPGYFPFRFLEQGKFRGRGYLKHSVLEQDFVVWMFAYGLILNQALPALLFCFSLHIIYEIGYYENDYLAAKTEESPTLFFELNYFKHYPISFGGWSCALLTGGLGVFMLYGQWNTLLAIKWLLLLILLRFVFYIYNRQPVKARLPFYVMLQTIKNFGGVMVLAINPVGLALAVAHAFQHTSVYVVYRCGGDKKKFPRNLMRMVVYLLGVAVITTIDASINPAFFALALAWCVYQILQEKHGSRYSIINLAIDLLFSLPIRIFRKTLRELHSLQSS